MGDPDKNSQKNDPKIGNGDQNMTDKTGMKILIQIPVIREKNMKRNTKGQRTDDKRSQKQEPNKIILEQKMPTGFGTNTFLFYFLQNLIA